MPVFVLAALLAIQGIAAPTGVVTGRIRLANGTPAVGIRVSAMLSSDGARSDAADAGALFSQTQTDEAGRYRLEGIPPGRYYIMAGRVDAPTFYPGKEDVLAATAISVAASKPVDGIDFTMTAASAQPPNPAFGGLVGGTFYLNGTPEISVPVRFRGENGNRIPLMSPQGRTQLSAKSAAGGVQTLSRGQPAIVQTDGTAILKTPAGTYQFAADNLPQDYEVKSMTVGSVDLLRSPFQLNGPLAAEIDVVLGLKNPAPRRTGRTVSGQIVDGLSSKPWLAEAVYISGSPGTVFSDGTFEFLSVNPGRYTLEAREGAPGDRTAQTSVVVGGADVKIDLAYTSVPTYVRVTGRIIVESGNTPRLGNARIVMRNTGTPIAIAADGNFKSALSEGNYVLSVQDLPPGYAVKSIVSGGEDVLNNPFRVQPQAGAVAPEIVVTLKPAPRFKVAGHVTADPPTRPVAGAEVSLVGLETFQTKVAADGSFEFPNVLPGPYAIAIRPFGFTYVYGTVLVVDQDQRLEFTAQAAY